MRREKLFLADIVEAADAIAIFIAGLNEEVFVGSDLVRSAVLQKLMIIGEAAARLPETLKEHHPDIPWGDIIGFRNVAEHGYFAMRWPTAWVIASEEAPELRQKIALILEQEYSAED